MPHKYSYRSSACHIDADDDDFAYPLSAAQREIWLSQQLNPDLPYNVSGYADINGQVDHAILNQAISIVIDETSALRTQFRVIDGTFMAMVAPVSSSLETPLHVIDVCHAQDPMAEALAWMHQDTDKVLRAEEGDLYIFILFKLSTEHFIWYQRYHHIIIDGRSVALLCKRIAEIYTLLLSGISIAKQQRVVLPPPSDNTYEASPAYFVDRAFWKHYLDSPPGPLWLSRPQTKTR